MTSSCTKDDPAIAQNILEMLCFQLQREYWLGPPKALPNEEEGADTTNLDPEFFEPPPANVPAGISIRNLRKVEHWRV